MNSIVTATGMFIAAAEIYNTGTDSQSLIKELTVLIFGVCISSSKCMQQYTFFKTFELEHNETNKMHDLCAQQRLRSAWTSAQSDQCSLFTWT